MVTITRHARSVRWFAVIALAVIEVGCEEDNGFQCEAPETTQYSCEPIPADSYGCIGGPVWRSRYTGPEHREEPDKVFPVGCRVTIPECGCCYTSGRGFECHGEYPEPNDAGIDGPLGPARWVEPL